MPNDILNIDLSEINIGEDENMKISEKVRELDGKEGTLIELAKQFLDVQEANYKIAGKDERVAYYVEPGSIMFRDKGKTFILEELTKVCGASGRYHDSDKKFKSNNLLNRVQKVILATSENEKVLRISTYLDLKGMTDKMKPYAGSGEVSIDMGNALRNPSNGETYEINCECKNPPGNPYRDDLKCNGRVWSV